jgi:uncharacterized protein YwqG
MAKRFSIEFVPCSELENISLRFGGEPFGLPAALWPVSKGTKEPMQFICQIPLERELFPATAEAVAYLFMTAGGGGEDTWSPDSGENALLLVPRNRLTDTLTVGDAPRLYRNVKKWWSKKLLPEVCSFSAKLTPGEDPAFIQDAKLMDMAEEQADAYRDSLSGNKLGGTPGFLQNDELPIPEPWHLLLQLDSAQVPFWINFGDAGIGYAFINGSGTEGKFLWQCC